MGGYDWEATAGIVTKERRGRRRLGGHCGDRD